MKEINETITEMKECRRYNHDAVAWAKADLVIEKLLTLISNLNKATETYVNNMKDFSGEV